MTDDSMIDDRTRQMTLGQSNQLPQEPNDNDEDQNQPQINRQRARHQLTPQPT